MSLATVRQLLADAISIEGPILRAFNTGSGVPSLAALVGRGSSVARRILARNSHNNTIIVLVLSQVVPSVASCAPAVSVVGSALVRNSNAETVQ